jgi:nuclear GTP-binding protein
MIDCPGVVYATDDTDTDILLKGVVRVENVAYTEDHIQALIDRCRKEYLLRTYNLEDFTDANDFLTQIAVKSGKLLKGGEADCTTIAKMVLNDWVRGKIPYYTLPPDYVLTKDLEVEENEKKKIRVNQRTKNIRVVNGFMADDTRGPEGEGESEDEGDLAVEGEGVSEGEDSEDEEEEEVDPEANWDKVFGGIDSDTVDSSTEQADTTIASIDDLESEQEVVAATGDTDSEEEEEVKVKEVVDTGKRMTTNKKKSTNYYTNANVKNKNKSKVVKKAPGKVNFKKSLPKKK